MHATALSGITFLIVVSLWAQIEHLWKSCRRWNSKHAAGDDPYTIRLLIQLRIIAGTAHSQCWQHILHIPRLIEWWRTEHAKHVVLVFLASWARMSVQWDEWSLGVMRSFLMALWQDRERDVASAPKEYLGTYRTQLVCAMLLYMTSMGQTGAKSATKMEATSPPQQVHKTEISNTLQWMQ